MPIKEHMWDSYKDQVSTILGIYQDKVIGHATKHLNAWKIYIPGARRGVRSQSIRDVRQTLAAHGATEVILRYEVIHVQRPTIVKEPIKIPAIARHTKQSRQLMKLAKVMKDLQSRSIDKTSTEIHNCKKGTARRYRSPVLAATHQVGDS